MTIFVNNAFSTKMVQENLAFTIEIITEEEFMTEVHKDNVHSVVGHEDTAEMFDLTWNRETLVLHKGDVLFVCEMNNPTGTRLPVGITMVSELPDGFFFRFLKVTILD